MKQKKDVAAWKNGKAWKVIGLLAVAYGVFGIVYQVYDGTPDEAGGAVLILLAGLTAFIIGRFLPNG